MAKHLLQEYIADPCGCKLTAEWWDSNGNTTEPQQIGINFCSLHKAAGQMRETLENIKQLVSQTLKGREAFRAIRREIKHLSQQALTATEPRPEGTS